MKIDAYVGNIYKCLSKDDHLIRELRTKRCENIMFLTPEYLSHQELYKQNAVLLRFPNGKYIDLDQISSKKQYKSLELYSELYYPEEFSIMSHCPIDQDELFVDESSLKVYSEKPITLRKLLKSRKK